MRNTLTILSVVAAFCFFVFFFLFLTYDDQAGVRQRGPVEDVVQHGLVPRDQQVQLVDQDHEGAPGRSGLATWLCGEALLELLEGGLGAQVLTRKGFM
jgi:hypothetical protein